MVQAVGAWAVYFTKARDKADLVRCGLRYSVRVKQAEMHVRLGCNPKSLDDDP